MKIRTTLWTKAKPPKPGVIGEFNDLAGAILFAGRYMTLARAAHKDVIKVKFEIVPARKR